MKRRTVLTGAAAVLAAGLTAAPPRAGANGTDPVIRSAAARGCELLALIADGDPAASYGIRRITVDAEHRVLLGDRLPADLPNGFHPHSMAARGEALWITGAIDELVKTVTVDNRIDALPERLRGLADPDDADPGLPDGIVELDVYRARPALLRVEDGRSRFEELPVPAAIGSGLSGAIVLPGRRGVAVSIEGCSDPELAIIATSHLALSADDGRTWQTLPVADGLGEGFGTVLASVGDRLLAVTADGDGTQSVQAGSLDSALRRVGVYERAGRPMAAVTTALGHISIYSDRDGTVSESRFTADGRALESAGTSCGCAGEVIAIQGLASAWLEADGETVRARGVQLGGTMAFPNASKAFSSSKCALADITRDHLSSKDWKMRYRTSLNSDGYGVHPSVTSFRMHEETHTQAGKVVRALHRLGQSYPPSGEPWSYRWTGVAGAKVCKAGYHRYGAAIDFTKFVWGPGQFVDMAVHGKDGRRRLRRRYLAAVAMCRKYFGTVLHLHNDPDGSHWNHIHVDRGRQAVALDWDYGTDVTIIQWAARDLAGMTDMVVDGDWGPQTKEGFELLRSRFKAQDVSPTASAVQGRVWLDLIGKHCMADENAGTFTVE